MNMNRMTMSHMTISPSTISQQTPALPAPPAPPTAPVSQSQALRQEIQRQVEQAVQQGVREGGGTRIQLPDGRVLTIGGSGVTQPQATTGQPAPPEIPDIPPGVVTVSVGFFVMVVLVAVGLPIARAIGRRMDRTAPAPARAYAENVERLKRIEQALDTVAIEVERVSENQRFVTRLLSEQRPDGVLPAAAAGAAAAVEVPAPRPEAGR